MKNNFKIGKELFYDVQACDRDIKFFLSENNYVILYSDGCFGFWKEQKDGHHLFNKKQFNEISRVRKKMMKIEKNSKILKELENEK